MEEDIKTGINEIVAQSPVETQKQASKKINFPEAQDGQSTFVTGDIMNKVADQTVTTPSRGIEFTPDTTEVYTGGAALPNLKYNTRRQTPEDRGNPLYFEPNYQPVVPYTVQTPYGPVESTTLDPDKLAWMIETSVLGVDDKNYIGYKKVPEPGTLGPYSHAVGAIKAGVANLPAEVAKGLNSLFVGTPSLIGRAAVRAEKDYLAEVYGMTFDDGEKRSKSLLAAANGADFKPSEEDKQLHMEKLFNLINETAATENIKKTIDDAANLYEQNLGNKLHADLEDRSAGAEISRGVSGAVFNFLTAKYSRNPGLLYTLLNMAGQEDMRKNALDAGASPLWADLYSYGGSAVNAVLDKINFDLFQDGLTLSYDAIYEMMKNGGYKFAVGKFAKGKLADTAQELLYENIQTGIEGAYDPDYLSRPLDYHAVSTISVLALSLLNIPSSVRHAKNEDRMKIAKTLGVEGEWSNAVKGIRGTLDRWVEEGKLNTKDADGLMEDIITKAPEIVVQNIRDGVLGQLDKVSPEEREQFATMLSGMSPDIVTAQQFRALDENVDTKLKDVNLPDSQKTMIKGIVRGLAQLKLLQDGTAPSSIEVPNFVVANRRGGSAYNPDTNTITISTAWSDVDYSKTTNLADTTNPDDFRNYMRNGFWPSTAQSDRMSSVIHELGHWIDYQLGEANFGDYLETYYKNIADVFGKDHATLVETAAKEAGTRTPGKMPKGQYANAENATEWNAQSLSRLGKRAAKQLGLADSQAQKFLSYANMMFNQIATWTDPEIMGQNAEILRGFKDAMNNAIKENMEILKSLINVFGEDQIKSALNDFLNDNENPNEDFTTYLAKHNMLKQLFDVMDSFADAAGLEKIGQLFDSPSQATSFVDKGNLYFTSGYDQAVTEIKQKRAERAQKQAQSDGSIPTPKQASNKGQQVTLQNGTTATLLPNGGLVGPDGIPNFGGDGGIDAVRALLKLDENVSEENVVEELIGIQANLPITAELNRAQQMMTEQVPAEQIFKETGWFLDNKDNKWKYEIPSGEVDTTGLGQYVQKPNGDKVYREKRGNLSDFYKNEKLYQAYPFLKNVPITLVGVDDGSMSGSTDYNGNDARFTIKYNVNDIKESAEHVLVHEIQHAIQFVEGFARGGTSSEFMNIGRIRNAYNVNGQEAGSKVLKEEIDKAWPKYQALAGEIEARNVQTRRAGSKLLPGLGNPEGVLPTLTQDVPDSQAIIKFDDVEINKFIPQGEVLDEIPNNYTFGTDPVAEIRDAVKQGENPVDEVPSYDKEVDGRKLGDDIDIMAKGIAARAKTLPNKIVKWFASSRWGWGLDRIVTTMFGRDVSNALDIGGKYTVRNSLRSAMYGRFMKELAPIIGDIDTDKRAAMFKYKTMLNNLGFVRVKGVEINDPYNADISTKRDLTGWEVMYVYLMKRMGEKYGNRVQQSTKTDINELIASLSDEEKQFGDAMSKTLRDVWVDIVGEDKAVVNYFPILSATHAVLDEVNIDTFKERMETNDPIAIDDAGRIFSKDISRLSSWQSGYYQTLKRLRDVLQYKGAEGRNIDPDVDAEMHKKSALLAGQVSNIFGRDGYHNLLRLLDAQIADPQDQMLDSASSKTLQQMGNNIIKGMLSFKFMSLPKNLANITMMWGGAKNQSTYWNGFAEGIANKKRTWEYMMKHSNEIRMRYNDAGYNEFLDQRNTGGSTAPIFKGISKLFANIDWTGDKTGGMAKMSAALDMMGEEGLRLFMLNGDAVANVYGGYGLIKDYMAQGMTEAEAFKKLDRYIVEHQSSSNLAMKPLGQLEANKSLAGQFMAFTSEGVSKWASILGTFDEVNMGTATKSEAIANAMSIAMSMLLFTALGAGAWDLWDDDEKVQEEAVKALEGAMVDQLFGGSVLGNGFLTPAVQGMLGLGGNMGISAPLWSFMTEGINNLKKGEYDRVITKSMEATGLFVGANALYNDLQGLMFMNSDDPDVREAGFRMLAGRTPGYAEKRTGAKIRKSSKEKVENSDEE